MTARFFISVLLLELVLCLSTASPSLAGGEDDDQQLEAIQLRIENAGPRPMRCVAVLAHFVTRDVSPIAPQETTEIELLRKPETGELAYGRIGDTPMMLENLLCGLADDWAASSGDTPILEIRSAPGRHFDLSCGRDVPFSCVLGQ